MDLWRSVRIPIINFIRAFGLLYRLQDVFGGLLSGWIAFQPLGPRSLMVMEVESPRRDRSHQGITGIIDEATSSGNQAASGGGTVPIS